MIYESLINLVNHKSLISPAYFILEFYCKPNCQVTKLSSYQIVRLPNCQLTKLLVTKLSSYQIVSYQIVTKLSSYQISIYQIVSYQNVSNQIIRYQ